jgi:hypothetical protein
MFDLRWRSLGRRLSFGGIGRVQSLLALEIETALGKTKGAA